LSHNFTTAVDKEGLGYHLGPFEAQVVEVFREEEVGVVGFGLLNDDVGCVAVGFGRPSRYDQRTSVTIPIIPSPRSLYSR